MDFSAWLVSIILPIIVASGSIIYYFLGREKESE